MSGVMPSCCRCLKNVFVLLMVCLCKTVHFLNFVTSQPQEYVTHATATLSQARYQLAATSSGELVFFGGGWNATNPFIASNRIDICNVTLGIWTTATLSVPRGSLAAASLGNFVFFAEGVDENEIISNQVDIYNVSNGSWSSATLTQARVDLVATSVEYFVLFAGGVTYGRLSNVVDIYNVTSNMWTSATLSQARNLLASTSVANRYALFAGGSNTSTALNIVDIYDSWSGLWNTTTLSQPRANLAASSLNDLAFFGGGDNSTSITLGTQMYSIVDIFNATSQTWNTTTLSQSRSYLAAASIGDIVAFGGGISEGFIASAVVDIYNMTSNMWFTLTLYQPRASLVATSSTNQILFGGGATNIALSNFVDLFCLNVSGCPSPPVMTPVSTATTSFITAPQSFGIATSTSLTNTTIPTTTQQSTFSPPNSSSSANNTELIMALLAGVLSAVAVLIVATIILLAVLIRTKRKNKKLKNEKNTEMFSIESETNLAQTSSQQGTRTEFVASQQTVALPQSSTSQSVFATVFPSPSVRRSQITFMELTVEKKIGTGSYGKVYLGRWNAAPVALKFCRKKGNLEDFVREIRLMSELPPHPNVVHLFGVSLDGPQPIIVLEYCAGGSLDKLLFQSNATLSDEHKMRLVRGIAAGMLHLHKHNIVHRDLAARNILLTASGDPKISDFGMSRILEKEDEGKTNSTVGPICWMAPESLAYRNYSKKSDVWTFGIVVYEIVAQCEPHKDQDLFVVGTRIRDEGLTPTIPTDCPPKLRELMQICWQMQPEQRPNFEMICTMLQQ
jgi:predicted Ser/Thr protein kinase